MSKGRVQRSAALPGTEERPAADAPAPDAPANETEPAGVEPSAPAAAAAPPVDEAPPAPEPPKPPPDPRDAIVARRREQLKVEVAEAQKDPQVRQLDEYAGVTEPATTPQPTVSPPAAEAPAQPAAAAPPGGDPVDGIKISVYGEEVVVSEDEVRTAGIATLQKERAAEYRLQQAATQEGRLRTYHQDLDAYAARLKALETKLNAGVAPGTKDVATVAAPPSSGAPAAGDAVLAAAALKVTEAIYRGDPKETAKALEALLADVAKGRTATPPPVDVKAVAEAAADVLGERTDEQKRQAVNKTFATEFKSVSLHPEAFAVAKTKFDALLADPDNSGKPLEDLAREAGKAALGRYPELREAPAGKGNEPPATPTAKTVDETLEKRRTLKTKTVVAPSTSSARAPAPQPQPVRSNKQYIADMRKQRGLPAS